MTRIFDDLDRHWHKLWLASGAQLYVVWALPAKRKDPSTAGRILLPNGVADWTDAKICRWKDRT